MRPSSGRWRPDLAVFSAFFLVLLLIPSILHSRPMTVDDVLSIVDVRDVKLSPDGKRILYVTRCTDLSKDRYVYKVWLSGTSRGSKVKLLGEGKLPGWSPDGSRFFWFSRKRGFWRLLVSDGNKSKSFPLKDGWKPVSASWSPKGDSTAILFEKTFKSSIAVYPPGPRKERALGTVDLESGSFKFLKLPGFINGFSWDPSGRRIVYSFRPSWRDQDIFRSRLAVVDVVTGRRRFIVDCPGHHTEPIWSPDGRFIAYLTRGCGGDWLETMYIKVIEPSSKSVWSYRLPGGVHIIRLLFWGDHGKSLFFLANLGLSRYIFRVSFPVGSVKRVVPRPGVYGNVSISRGKGLLAFSYEGWKTTPDVYISRIDGSNLVKLTSLNRHLGGLDLGGFDALKWRDKSGFDVEGIVGRPVSAGPGKHPLLVYLHGGPASSFLLRFSPGRYYYPVQVFLGMGFYVFMPNPAGSIGYSEGFRKAIKGKWGIGLEDVFVGLDKVLRMYPVDPKRIGVMGWSYGGYLTLLALSRDRRFKMGSEGGGIFDLLSFYGTTDVPDWLDAYFGCSPYGGCLESYLLRSPVVEVDGIKAPLLIFHGEKDRRVPLSQSMELYRALRRLGTPTKLVVYSGQGHVVTRPSFRKDCLLRGVRWFGRLLGGSGLER